MKILAATLVLLLLFGGFVAHWPVRFSGPLARHERVRRVSTGRLVVGWGRIVLAIGAVLAAMLLLQPLRPSSVLVLHSRARGGEVEWSHVTSVGGQRDPEEIAALCDPSSSFRDLGGSVDRMLDSLKAAPPQNRVADGLDIARIRGALAARGGPPVTISELAAASRSIPTGLPMSAITSLELSEIRLSVSQLEVSKIFVAPPPIKDISPWRILAADLRRQGVTLCLVDERDLGASRGLVISKLAAATSKPDGTLEFWAVIDGKTDGSSVELEVREPGKLTPSPFSIRPPNDNADSRIVFACIGSCPNSALESIANTTPTLEVLKTEPTHRRTLVALAPGRTSGATEPIRLERDLLTPPKLTLSPDDSTHRARWKAILNAFPEESKQLASELATYGRQLPTLLDRGRAQAKALLREANDYVVIAEDEGAAAAAEAWLKQQAERPPAIEPAVKLGTLGPPPFARVVSAKQGPSSLFSWHNLVPPGQPPSGLLLPATDSDIALGIAIKPKIDDGLGWKPTEGLAISSFAGEKRYTILKIAVAKNEGLLTSDPFVGLALVRSIAWAASEVTRPPHATSKLSLDDAQIDLPSAPVVTQGDLDAANQASLSLHDTLCLLVVTLYFAVSVISRARLVKPERRQG